MIRVVVADDQPLVRNGIRGILESAPDLSVVAEAADGAEAIAAVRRTQPDVVLIDVRMPRMDGLTATRTLTRTSRSAVVVLTTFDLDEYVWAAIEAGASGFLLKDTPPAGLQDAVRVVASGDALLSPSVTRRVLHQLSRSRPWPARTESPEHDAGPSPGEWESVTPRERQVLDLVTQGLSNAEIATRLHLSPGTVKTHVSSLLTKLGVRDRVHLVIASLRNHPSARASAAAAESSRSRR